MTDHYVASIKVEKVTRRVDSAVGATRNVTEGLHMTVKASTLEGLKTKVNSHMTIMDEEDIQ